MIELPGASGAALKGEAIQPHHPNPQLSPSSIVSIPAIISSTFASIFQRELIKSSSLFLFGDMSSLSIIPSPSLSLFIVSSASVA